MCNVHCPSRPPFCRRDLIALFLMYRNVYQGLTLPLGISIALLMGAVPSTRLESLRSRGDRC